jgi:hypothetical protein
METNIELAGKYSKENPLNISNADFNCFICYLT